MKARSGPLPAFFFRSARGLAVVSALAVGLSASPSWAKQPTRSNSHATTPAKTANTARSKTVAKAVAGKPAPAPKQAPAPSKAGPVGSAAIDPFAALKVIIPKDKLPPLRTVWLHDRKKGPDLRSKEKITVRVTTSPGGAAVSWGRRSLGKTPVVLVSPPNSTPVDLVIRRKGYMTLRTRIQRTRKRSYHFRLSPAKFR